jgi:hypothetical protein
MWSMDIGLCESQSSGYDYVTDFDRIFYSTRQKLDFLLNLLLFSYIWADSSINAIGWG